MASDIPTFPSFKWITDPSTLHEFIASLQPPIPIAIDTEADSLHHYKESVCLIQVTHRQIHFLIDPLHNFSLKELWPAISKHTWVLHGADFDLRMLRRAGALEPLDVFDTLIAAQLLGMPAVSYGALVEQLCGVMLDKKNQKADWSKRPLHASMLEYAVQDTCYLELIAEILRQKLAELGRLEWHQQSCNRVLIASRVLKEVDLENEWRISGSTHLAPMAQAIVKEMWYWREKEAEAIDQPVFKILHNELLLHLAIWAANNLKIPPMGAPGWPRRCPSGRTDRMAEAIERGRQAPPIAPIPRAARPPHSPHFESQLEKLRALRDKIATDLKIDPTFLAPKSTLIELAREPETAPARLIAENRWSPWQAELLKPALLETA